MEMAAGSQEGGPLTTRAFLERRQRPNACDIHAKSSSPLERHAWLPWREGPATQAGTMAKVAISCSGRGDGRRGHGAL